MGLHKEIWLETLVEDFFPDDSFSSKSINDNEHVNYNRVHIPNAGKPSNVRTNGVGPAENITQRIDDDLEYGMDKLQTEPRKIEHAETKELSYDKRKSALAQDRLELQRVAHVNILHRWAKEPGAIIFTTGKAVAPHTYDGATGKRKAITRADVLSIMTEFNKQELPAEGRYLLLDAEMYTELLEDLSESAKSIFYASANVQKGILGSLYGVNIMMRSSVLRIKADGETLIDSEDVHEATECAAALAWHESCVSRALGEIKMFGNTDDPVHYGDIFSFEMRVGGSRRRIDKKGIIILAQATHN